MPRRSLAAEPEQGSGGILAAKPATYTLHAETGRFSLTGGTWDVVGHWLGRVMDLTGRASSDLAAVEELRGRILTGLGALRDTGSATRAAAEDAIVAALALGFYHTGGSAVAQLIEQAVKSTRSQGTADAREALSLEPGQVEGAKAREIIHKMCLELWCERPEILEQPAWVQNTIKKIHAGVVEAMRPHIADGSKWADGSDGLRERMANHVRSARKLCRD